MPNLKHSRKRFWSSSNIVIVKGQGIRDVIWMLAHFRLTQLSTFSSKFVVKVRQLSQESVIGSENDFVKLLYRAFHGFGQAKFAYGGSTLGSSQFPLLPSRRR